MIRAVNRLGDRMLNALLPKTEAAAASCICCPGGQHSIDCRNHSLYVLSCCCQWQFTCSNCC